MILEFATGKGWFGSWRLGWDGLSSGDWAGMALEFVPETCSLVTGKIFGHW
jgi:hypothetical protein